MNCWSFIFSIALLVFPAIAYAGTAPAALRGKSVSLFWAESNVFKSKTDGKQGAVVGRYTLNAYVSEVGRGFLKIAGSAGSNNHSIEDGPEVKSSGFTFGQNSMSIVRVNTGIARRFTISFDPTFSNCSASVAIGKVGPKADAIGFDGATYEILSIQTNGVMTCSVQAGNILAR